MSADADSPISMPGREGRANKQQAAQAEASSDKEITADVTLTIQQQRALVYISRRHMRQPRIKPRHTPERLSAESGRPQGSPPHPIATPAPTDMPATDDLLSEQDMLIGTDDLLSETTIATDDLLSEQDTLIAAQAMPESLQPPVTAIPPVIPTIPPATAIPPVIPMPPVTAIPPMTPMPPVTPMPLVMPALLPTTPLPMVVAQTFVTTRDRDVRKKWLRRKTLRHFARKRLRAARVQERQRRFRLWLSIASTLLSLFILLSSLIGTGVAIAYRFYNQTQQQYQRQVLTLEDLLPLDNLKVYDSKGVLIGQMADQGVHTTVTFNQIAANVRDATVATEDKNFWTNEGVDPLRITRAALDNLRNGQVVEGGSTITQQLIKNLVVGNEVSLQRKLEEITLVPDLNSHYSKSDILTMYLNTIYYGQQAYGIDAAAQLYFGLQDQPGKSGAPDKAAAMQLDLAQSAMLAGIPSSPYAYDPLLHPQAAFQRFRTVLEAMIEQDYITRVQALDAVQEAQSPNFFKPATLNNRAPHFFNFVLQQLEQQLHRTSQQLSRSGMQVYTTLDIALQDKIQKIMQQHVAELRDAHHVTNAAEVLIDFHTGAILSLLGSIDYNDASIDGQFDVATQGYRQPGSSFKPYVYVTAFEQGASPAQAIDDQPTTIALPPGSDPPTFTPHNYDLNYHGHMTLRCALQNSLNVPAVKVLQHVGIDAAMQTASNMGIASYEGTPGYSLVLGGLSVRLIDHTSAMGVFANGGVRVGYYAIERIVSGNTGKVLYSHKVDPGKRVLSPQMSYLMTNVLSDNTDRIPEFFDCNVLQLYSNSQNACYYGNRGAVRPAAVKTGTTQNFRDNWTVGYTTDYVMGVWAGNDDNTPMYNITGVQGAAPIWHDSMLLAEQGHPIRDFVNPGGLVRATVTYADGVKTTDWFLPGTIPTYTPINPSPTATTGMQGSPTQEPGSSPVPQGPVVAPYCPDSYSFAFPPSATSTTLDGWW